MRRRTFLSPSGVPVKFTHVGSPTQTHTHTALHSYCRRVEVGETLGPILSESMYFLSLDYRWKIEPLCTDDRWTLSVFIFCLFFCFYPLFIHLTLLCFYFYRSVKSYQAHCCKAKFWLCSEAQYPQLCSCGSDNTWGRPLICKNCNTWWFQSCLNLPALFGMCTVTSVVQITFFLSRHEKWSLWGNLQWKGKNVRIATCSNDCTKNSSFVLET